MHIDNNIHTKILLRFLFVSTLLATVIDLTFLLIETIIFIIREIMKGIFSGFLISLVAIAFVHAVDVVKTDETNEIKIRSCKSTTDISFIGPIIGKE